MGVMDTQKIITHLVETFICDYELAEGEEKLELKRILDDIFKDLTENIFLLINLIEEDKKNNVSGNQQANNSQV